MTRTSPTNPIGHTSLVERGVEGTKRVLPLDKASYQIELHFERPRNFLFHASWPAKSQWTIAGAEVAHSSIGALHTQTGIFANFEALLSVLDTEIAFAWAILDSGFAFNCPIALFKFFWAVGDLPFAGGEAIVSVAIILHLQHSNGGASRFSANSGLLTAAGLDTVHDAVTRCL